MLQLGIHLFDIERATLCKLPRSTHCGTRGTNGQCDDDKNEGVDELFGMCQFDRTDGREKAEVDREDREYARQESGPGAAVPCRNRNRGGKREPTRGIELGAQHQRREPRQQRDCDCDRIPAEPRSRRVAASERQLRQVSL